MFNKIKLALAVSSMGLLFACGGGGGVTAGGGGGGGALLSGKVIDGPISGATVCLDLNGNYACDGNDPTATTDSVGNYSLPSYSGSVGGLHILAVVPAGAIDLDTNSAITKGYTLMAPASNPSAVTPLTTLVSAQMQVNPKLTATEAEQITLVSNRLQVQTTTILDKDPTQSADLHRIAQAVATTIAQTAASLNSNSIFTTATQASNAGTTAAQAAIQAIRITQSDLLLKLQNIDGTINANYLTGNGLNTTAITAIADNIVNDAIETIAATTKAGKFGTVDMNQAIQSGIAGFQVADGGFYTNANNIEQSVGSHFRTERFVFDPTKAGAYHLVAGTWRPDSKHNFDLINGTWVAEFGNVANSVIASQPTINENCFIAPQTPQGVNLSACATSVDIAGKKLSDFNFNCKDPSGATISGCDINAVFPVGSLGYNFQVTYDVDQYQLEIQKNAVSLASDMPSFIGTYSRQGGPYHYFIGTKLAMNIASYDPATKRGILNWYDNSTGSFATVSEASPFVVELKNGIGVFTADLPNIYYRLGGDGDQTTLFAFAPAGINTGSQAGIYQGHKYSSKKATNIYFGRGDPNMMNMTAYNFLSAQYRLPTLP